MNNLKRILSITLGGIVLFATTCFAKTGIVNAPNGLILREEPKSGDNVIMTVSDDSKVEILEKDGEWYKVKYNSHEGYLFAEYVEVEEQEEETTTQTEGSVESEENKEEQTEKTEGEETQTEVTEQKQKVKSDLKIYSIPSVTAKTITTVKTGEEVTINYELNNWVNITYGKTTGWARKYFINNEIKTEEPDEETTEIEENVEGPKVEEEKKTETEVTIIDNKKGYVDVSTSANIREKASTSSNIINTLLRNTEVTITAEEGDFYKIKYQDITGYISKSLISDKPVEEVTSRGNSGERNTVAQATESTEIKENETTNETTTNTTSSEGSDVVSYAKKYIGYDYVSGGTTPSTGFDCSGFTYYVFNSCGYSLSRSCQVQAQSGTAVSRGNLSAGDLVFFDNGSNGSIGHVGIYIGGGQFVHAENARTGVRIDTINSGYYDKYYYSARRIVD